MCLFLDQFIIPDGVQHQMLQFLSGAQWPFDIYTVSSAQKALTVQKASGSRRAPTIRWKAPATPLSAGNSCATVRCSHSILGPRTGPSEERLEFLRPGQDTPPSSERLEFLCNNPIAAPVWSNRGNRGTVYALPREDAILEGRMLTRQEWR